MAETRRSIAWASFVSERTRLSNHGMVPAVIASDATKLYLDFVDGLPFLTIEDAAFPRPTSIPFTNVASLAWSDVPVPAKVSPKAKSEAAA